MQIRQRPVASAPASRASNCTSVSSTPSHARRREGGLTVAAAAAAAARTTAADGAAAANGDSGDQGLTALLAPRLARLLNGNDSSSHSPLPAAIFWDADNVRPPASSPSERRTAVRRRLAGFARALERAGHCRVALAAAYGNAATLGEEDEEEAEGDTLTRLVVTSAAKRQSADLALQSNFAAFVEQSAALGQRQRQEQQQEQPQQQRNQLSSLVLLVADDAGYAGPCAWATSLGAVVVAAGPAAARRGRYSLPGAPADPSRHHPLAKAGHAAAVVPWVLGEAAGGDVGGGILDASEAWIDPEGLLGP